MRSGLSHLASFVGEGQARYQWSQEEVGWEWSSIGGVNRFKNNEQQLSLVREKVIKAVGIDLATVLDEQAVNNNNEKTDDLLSSDDLAL